MTARHDTRSVGSARVGAERREDSIGPTFAEAPVGTARIRNPHPEGDPYVLCQTCGKADAVVRLTDMIDGKKQQVTLCAGCAQNKGFVIEPATFELAQAPAPPGVEQLIAPVIEALKSMTPKPPAPAAAPESVKS